MAKREQWGYEGQNIVTSAHDFYLEISSLVEAKQPAELETVSSLLEKREAIDAQRISWGELWRSEASGDKKGGGSHTMLFTAVHVLLRSAENLWAAYALDVAEPDNEISEAAFKVFRTTAENAWGNSQQLPNYGYKVSQQNGSAWATQMMGFFVNANLDNALSARAKELNSVPEEWFPNFS